MASRIDKDEYFMSMTLLAAERASCPRRKVGCILVDTKGHVVSTGYNGPASGVPNCTEHPCGGQSFATGQGLSSCIAIHAEMNAVAQAGDRLPSVETMYLSDGVCCEHCTESIVELIKYGRLPLFKRIVYFNTYPSGKFDVFKDLNIEMVNISSRLPETSTLFQLAVILNRAKPKTSNKILCVGGPLHGELVDNPNSRYLRVPLRNTLLETIDLATHGHRSPTRDMCQTEEVVEYYMYEIYDSFGGKIPVFSYSKLDEPTALRLYKELVYKLRGNRIL